ncbi:MAG TPA: ribonuclease J [Mycobacteriales bacterium]|nr:ribonuclease J [Mycobacteriales bacterium]
MSHPHPELTAPPALPDGALRIVALGGLGEIGRNMTVFEYGGRLLIVDCGVLFPETEQPGVDLILPDFSYIRERLDDIEAVVLTHGHEDHIGAVPFLLRERVDVPIVGSRFTLALLAAKLQEHRIKPVLDEVREEDSRTFGPFELEFFAVNHSVPDGLALAIRTPAGVVLHSGDFKMDQTPIDGRLTDLGGFARLGRSGIDLLLSDSTNAEMPGFVTSEREVGEELDRLIAAAPGRVIVACFASHVHRVQQVMLAAHRQGRHVALVGRSMIRNMGVARDLGYLQVPGGLLVEIGDFKDLPDDKVVLISTGSQGEPLSALSRMANRDHHHIRIVENDTVVLASSLIPGNENAVFRVINGLSRWGARVVHKGIAKVHVSGHAPAGELLYLLNATKPRNFLPIHGEWRHLRAHAALAEATGVPRERIVIADDGVVVDLVGGVARIVGAIPCGYVYVDGLVVGDVSEMALKDRRILGEEGFITVVVVVDSATGKVTSGPEFFTRGFADPGAGDFDEARRRVEDALAEAGAEGIGETQALQQLVRRTLGRWVSDTYGRRPMIIPVVVEV